MPTATAKEYPILFRPELVRKILDGKKTQTRRPVKPQPEWFESDLVEGGVAPLAALLAAAEQLNPKGADRGN